MTDTLKARMKANKGQGDTKDYHRAVDDCIALLDEWSKSPEVLNKVGAAIEDAVGDSNGEWTAKFKRYVAQAALSALIGDNTKREG